MGSVIPEMSFNGVDFPDPLLVRKLISAFLDHEAPILLLEDMNLVDLDAKAGFKQIVVAPMTLASCDGLPCMGLSGNSNVFSLSKLCYKPC